MTFIPHNPTPALLRQFNDTRSFHIRVKHWMYFLCRERSETAFKKHKAISIHITDNRTAWRKKFQSKTSLNLRSGELTQERRGE